jgi:hypothetical protein
MKASSNWGLVQLSQGGPLIRFPGERARRARHYANRPLAVQPTQASPGSEAKIQVMIERRARGEELFHPGDASSLVAAELDRGKVLRLWDRGPGTGHTARPKTRTAKRDKACTVA